MRKPGAREASPNQPKCMICGERPAVKRKGAGFDNVFACAECAETERVQDADKRAGDFADSMLRQMVEQGTPTADGGGIFSMTPEMMFQAFIDAGDCWICGNHDCIAHSRAIQRAAFEAERENMGRPLTFQIKGT